MALSDEDFLHMFSDGIEHMMMNALHAYDDDDKKQQEVAMSVSIVSSGARTWILKGAVSDAQAQNKNPRCRSHIATVRMVHDAIQKGLIVFNTEEDISLFQILIYLDISFYPELVHRYLGTGEFMEVLQRVLETDWSKSRGLAHSDDHLVTAGLVTFRTKLFRLYAYDLLREREQAAEGLPVEDPMLIPLEIRLDFSGFQEDLSIEEVQWDIRARHEPMTKEEIFSLFQETRRAGDDR